MFTDCTDNTDILLILCIRLITLLYLVVYPDFESALNKKYPTLSMCRVPKTVILQLWLPESFLCTWQQTVDQDDTVDKEQGQHNLERRSTWNRYKGKDEVKDRYNDQE